MNFLNTWKKSPFAFVFLCLALGSALVSGAENGDVIGNDQAIELKDDVPEAQMLSHSQEQLAKSKYVEMFVRSMMETARKEKDTVKILCIDDKLTQIQSLLKSIDSRMNSLDSALKSQDSGAARHHFVIMQVSFNKLNSLRVQADTCVGNSDIVIGATESEVSVSEDITTEEATTPEQEIFTPEATVRPTVASGFR